MAQMPRQPLFLARSSYRQRRLRDAIRFLPITGIVLLMLPLLWPRGPDGPGNGQVLIYIFSAWSFLILLSFLLTRRLRNDDAEEGNEPKAEDG
ncbi:hypothetical protein [Flavimaricola marinus]|uniref:Uncharacterized protein n=1 Tax=Flavimaricola marinus TaxID=1819565 RepID=A0A238LJK5_9RHOB|nr:hypothetical protein [Flavimaricola marinus]SMY09575.1 hypothetical protein LOM8899_03742 [Flavimaricola marinus]